MRIELPEGYVPPQPTHPHYGYLTPQERAALEAAERAEGIVPGVEPQAGGAEAGAEVGTEAGTEVAGETPDPVEALGPEPVAPVVSEPPVAGPEGETRPRRTGWVPQPPSPPRAVPAPAASAPAAPAEEAPAAAFVEMRWDAYRQEWVAVDETAPPPDVAAAAGGRGSSSSWTSANGQRFRWDAHAQEWVTERPEA